MSRRLLILLVASAALSTPAMAWEDEQKREIVVTARSLKDTGDALKKCLSQKCPPDQDIKATLAHAENLFVEGDYKTARSTLLSSLGRNRKHRGKYAEEVSNLLRANGNVAEHLGEANSYRLSILDMRDTLKSAYAKDDIRVLGAEIEVADSRQRLGYMDEARDKYATIAEQALTMGKPKVAAIARLRRVSSFIQEAQKSKTDFAIKEAEKEIDAFMSAPPKGAEDFTIVAEILRTRLDRKSGNKDSTDSLIKRYVALGYGADRPMLITANPIDNNTDIKAARMAQGGSDLNRVNTSVVEDRWVDIGFWINSEGRVEDTEILRSEGSTDWVAPVVKSLKSRIYTPAKSKNGTDPGFYAVERYSLTADWVYDNTGTRIRQRSAVPKIQRMDLSE
jgi:hypothetical protein